MDSATVEARGSDALDRSAACLIPRRIPLQSRKMVNRSSKLSIQSGRILGGETDSLSEVLKVRFDTEGISMSAPEVFEERQVAPFRDEFERYSAGQRRTTITQLLTGITGHPEYVGTSVVSHVMSEARQLVESMHERDQERYRWLRLYCHLCVHSSLARDKHVYDLLDEIAQAFSRAMNEGGAAVENVLYRVIPSVLSPARLRQNLRALFAEFGLPAEFWDDDAMWANFVNSLGALIVWKRIELPLHIVWDEIQRIGSLDQPGPPCEEPTKATEADRLNRRAMKYFRRMVEAIGFASGVPISLQLAPVRYLHRLLKDKRSEEDFQQLAQRICLSESYPGHGCWLIEAPGRLFFAPFSPSGELLDLSIGESKNVGIVVVHNG